MWFGSFPLQERSGSSKVWLRSHGQWSSCLPFHSSEFKGHCSPQKYDYISSGISKDFHNDEESNLCKKLFRSFGVTLFQWVDMIPAGICMVPQGRCRAAELAPSAWAPGSFLETRKGFVFLRPSPWSHSSLPSSDSGSCRDWWLFFGSSSWCSFAYTLAQIYHYMATKIRGFPELEHQAKWSFPSTFMDPGHRFLKHSLHLALGEEKY